MSTSVAPAAFACAAITVLKSVTRCCTVTTSAAVSTPASLTGVVCVPATIAATSANPSGFNKSLAEIPNSPLSTDTGYPVPAEYSARIVAAGCR